MSKSTTTKILTMKIFGKSLVNGFLRANKWVWKKFPSSVTSSDLFRMYGDYVHKIGLLSGNRIQNVSTFFFRNRPQLELIKRIADKKEIGSKLNIAILGCSKGAEVYSVIFLIRSNRPDLEIKLHAVDISKEALESAQRGIYSQSNHDLPAAPVFERISEHEIEMMFDKNGDALKIKPWIREGIIWHFGDVAEQKIIEDIGHQDIVVANNFLCHMAPSDSERCLRNIAKLVRNSGYLFLTGIDLDVRLKVVRDLSWRPVCDSIKNIHDGDHSLRNSWPWGYWGLEPFNENRTDWELRYATAFQIHGEHRWRSYPASK